MKKSAELFDKMIDLTGSIITLVAFWLIVARPFLVVIEIVTESLQFGAINRKVYSLWYRSSFAVVWALVLAGFCEALTSGQSFWVLLSVFFLPWVLYFEYSILDGFEETEIIPVEERDIPLIRGLDLGPLTSRPAPVPPGKKLA